MKVVKVSLAVLGALLALFVVAGVVVFWLFDPNDYKDYVAEQVTERTGRSFAIEDDLELSFFPWLAVETGGLELGNAEGFGELPMVRIERASARVKLLPLVRRQIEIGTVVLEGLALDLARDADGRDNWSDLLNARAGTPDGAAEAESSPGVAALDIEGIAIRGGRIIWRDAGRDRSFVVDDLRFVTGPITAGTATEVELELTAVDSTADRALGLTGRALVERSTDGAILGRDLHFDFALRDAAGTTRLSGNLEFESIDISDDGTITLGHFALDGRAFQPPIGPNELELGARLTGASFDSQAGSLAIEGLTTSVAGIVADWQLSAQSLLDEPALAGRVTVAATPLANVVHTFSLTPPAGIARNELGNLSLATRFRGSLEDGEIALEDIDATALGVRIRGQARLMGADRLTANLDVPAFAVGETLRAWLAAYLPEGIDAGAFERLAFRGTVGANLDTRAVSIRDLSADLLGATITGQIDLTRPGDRMRVEGRLASSRFAPAPFVRAFDALLTDTVDPSELGTLSFDTRFSYDSASDAARLDPLAVEVFGLSASGSLSASALSSAPAFQGRAEVAEFAPRELLRRFNQTPPATSDDTALVSARISTRFDISSERGRFDELLLVLDDSRITGRFVVVDFNDPSYRFTLAADRLDVDRYLPPPAEEAADDERAAGDIELSAQALNAVTIAGRAEVDDLVLAGLSFEDVAAELDFGAGKANIGPARAKLYGGAFSGALNVDTTGELPTMSLKGKATTLAIEPLIEALVGDAHFSGTGDLDIELTGRGSTVTDTVHSAAGTISFALRDGAITGFNLGRTLCQVYNARAGLPAPPRQPARTRYTLIQGAATVKEGIARVPDLLARAPFLDVTGSGRVALVEQALDFELDSTLTGSIGIEGCDGLDGMIGDSFPWTLKGTVTEAQIRPDFSEYLRRRAEDELRDRARERLQDKLQDRLRNLL